MSAPLVLCYHGVGSAWPSELCVTPTSFERQVAWVAARGYRTVTFSEAARARTGARVVAITFDDGYRSVFENALPILARAGAVATVFAPTAFIDSEVPASWPGVSEWLGTEYERELLPLSWRHLRELVSRGWEIGSHTRTHPRLPDLDDAALDAELRESRRELERALGRRCESVAYPYGDCDARVVAAARAAGYNAGAQVARELAPGGGRLAVPRIAPYRSDGRWRFRAKVSPRLRMLRRRGGSLRRSARASATTVRPR